MQVRGWCTVSQLALSALVSALIMVNVGVDNISALEKEPVAPKFVKSAAFELLDLMLEASGNEVDRVGARPTILARQMAIVVTSMYDAWAAYDAKAVGTRFGGKLRRPAEERTDANKKKAMAYAVYRSLLYVYADDAKWITEQMRKFGIDPDDNSTDPSTPQGIGNVTAAAVIEWRRHDGANQHGDEVGSSGKPYSDYTYYRPANTAEKCVDPDCWQPIYFDNPKGQGKVLLSFLTPQWYRVKTFGLKRSDQFRPGPPPKVGSEQLKKEVDECIAVNGNLSTEQKAIVEFMRDGPRSTGQSGHWLRFAQDVSRRDRHSIDQDVKLYFAVANTALDTFIACWDVKRYYDSSRPWTLVRHYYKGETIKGWAGPGKGVTTIPAEQWHPYSPRIFVTPPFPGYTSGHATVSGGCAKTLELFTGSDKFGEVEKRKAGSLTEEGYDCKFMQMVDGKLPKDLKLTCDVALKLPTFTATAEMAALSRLWGGYHIRSDNEAGLKHGQQVAKYLWPIFQAHFDGTATVRD